VCKYNCCRAALPNKAGNAESCAGTALQKNDKKHMAGKGIQLLKKARSTKFLFVFISAHEMCIQM
jgi:hypothetical protein